MIDTAWRARPRADVITTWRPRLVQRTSLTWMLPLILIVASQYKFRRRDPMDTTGGSVDLFILLELAIYMLVAAYLVVRIRPTMRRDPIMVWIVGYCLTVIVSVLYAPTFLLAMVRGVELAVVLLVVLQFGADGDVAMVRRFLHGLIVVTMTSIAIGLAFVAPQPLSQEGRFTWLYVHSGVAGEQMSIVGVVLFGMWLTHRAARLPWPRWVYGVLLVIVVFAVVANKTRGAVAGGLAGVVVMAFLWARARGKRDLVVAGLLAGGVIVMTMGGVLVRYAMRDGDTANLATLNNRTQLWSMAWDIFSRRPLHGAGFTATRTVFLDETGLGGAHNAYFNVLVDTGLVGMFWWVGLFALVIARIHRLRRRAKLHAGASPLTFDLITLSGVIVCLLVNGLVSQDLGAGLGAPAMVLFLSGVWVLVCGDAMDGVEALAAAEDPE
jgi:exopolysaccharide production protein ExoQ